MKHNSTFWKGSVIVCFGVCFSVIFNKSNKKSSYICNRIDSVSLSNVDKNLIANNGIVITNTRIKTSLQNKSSKKNTTIYNSSFSSTNDLLCLTSKASKSQNTLKHNINGDIFISFRIFNNLYSDARKSGVPQAVISKIITLYKSIINFKVDLKEDDIVSVFYKESDSTLLFTSIKSKKKEKCIYGYNQKGSFCYYDDSGVCLNKDTFLIPVKGARISSKFGVRIHPVKKIKKVHRGTDFAASTGTPIMASNSGKIVYIGNRGGYGKCIIIRHNNGYKTLYGHMSKYAPNSFLNKMVYKGDIIGYVGKTGIATGPHLHFEIIKNNIRINPEKANLISLSNLTKQEKTEFEQYKKSIKTKIRLSSNIY